MNKKKKKRLLLTLFLLIGIGVTVAYFYSSTTFSNIFVAHRIPTIITREKFESPDGWKPGDTTEKIITTTNEDSEEDICIRVKFDESWVSKNNEDLPLYQDGNKAALINLINTDKWIKAADGWYYYQVNLATGESSVSPLESVTFNPAIIADIECVDSVDTDTGEKVKTCTSTGDGYDGAKYTLDITTEAIECKHVDDYWNPKYTYLYDAVANSNNKVLYEESDFGSVDTLSTLENPEKIYFTTSSSDNNVLFANKCWKIVRTTETGGVKLYYSGAYNDTDKCDVNEYLTYGEYPRTYQYQIWTPMSSVYYGAQDSIWAGAGYMYNRYYNDNSKNLFGSMAWNHICKSNYLISADVSYDTSNGKYTLIDPVVMPYSTSGDYNGYCCLDGSSSCETVFFDTRKIYNGLYLSNGMKFEDAVNDMLYADDVNKYDSDVKSAVDNWYKNNLLNYTDYLEDIVYCSDRSIIKVENDEDDNDLFISYIWRDPSDGDVYVFKYYYDNKQLSCDRITDKFSVSNSKAKLTYPIALLSKSETYYNNYFTYSNGLSLEKYYWIVAEAGYFAEGFIADGASSPVISLKPKTLYSSGTGSVSDPYVIE